MLIVSKDSDFRQRSFLFGAPPKVVSIALGNCSTKAIEDTLRRHFGDLNSLRPIRKRRSLSSGEKVAQYKA
jgi:predicted nuclease of predicted toxin-antitoxin system